MAIAPQLLAADSVSGQSTFLKDIPPGKYSDIVVRFSGDAAAAQTFAAADLGRIRLIEAGRDLVAADADNLRLLNMLKGGSSRIQATAAGASAMTVRLPRGFGDGNVHQVIEADVVQVAIQMGANFTTKFTAADPAQIKVYGLVRETGEMTYNFMLTQMEQTYGSGTFTYPIRQENVIAIYPIITGDLDRLRVVKDGQEMANVQQGPNAQDNDLVSISDLFNETDAPDAVTAFVAATGANADSTIAAIEVAEVGNITEYLSDDVVCEWTVSPAATFVQEFLVASADFTPTKLRQTKVEQAATFQRKVARKNNLGRGRPIQAIRIAGE